MSGFKRSLHDEWNKNKRVTISFQVPKKTNEIPKTSDVSILG